MIQKKQGRKIQGRKLTSFLGLFVLTILTVALCVLPQTSQAQTFTGTLPYQGIRHPGYQVMPQYQAIPQIPQYQASPRATPQYPASRQFQASPVKFEGQIKLVPTRLNLNLRDQWSEKWDKTKIELSALALVEGIRVRYAVIPTYGASFVTIPTSSLIVGSSEFGQDPTKQGQTQSSQQKPVTLDWQLRTEHRLELAWMWAVSPIRPMILAEWSDVCLTATGEKDGKQITDSQTWRKGFLGFGGLLQYETGGVRVAIHGVAGQGFSRAEGQLIYALSPWSAFTLGYLFDERRLDELRVKQQAVTLGLLGVF